MYALMGRAGKQQRVVIALGILLACCPHVFGLDPSLDINQYAHTAWKAREDFFKGIIFSIAQTSDGYLWLGTEFGLLRFDGVRSVPWRPPAGQHLPSSEIRALLVARDGELWIGTLEGLASWKDGKLTQYAELAGQVVGTLLEDREGTIWAGGWATSTGKACAIQNRSAKCYGEDGSLGHGVYSLYEDSGGNLWLGAVTGLWRWKPGPPKLYPMPDPAPGINSLIEGDNGALLIAMRGGIRRLVERKSEVYPLPGVGRQFTPTRLLRDRNGGLWIGTADRGLLHVHQGRTDLFSRSDGLSGDWVGYLFEDREGNIWVATGDGLDRFREFAVPTLSVKQGLSDAVGSVLAARDGSVWLGAGGGLNRWNNSQITIYRRRSVRAVSVGAKREQELGGLATASESSVLGAVREITSSGLPDEEVNSLTQDNRGRIWVFTSRGVAYFDNGRFIRVSTVPGRQVFSSAGDGAGNVWVSHQDQGLIHLLGGNVVERIPWAKLGRRDVATALLPDPAQGGLWLGFHDGGVAYLKDGQVRAPYAGADGLGAGRVSHLRFGSQGALWAATVGGLSRIKDGRVVTLTSKNGLPCDAALWSIEDDDHAVWVYTACGLVRIARTDLDAWVRDPSRTVQTTVFDTSDGVRSHSFIGGTTPRVAKSADGRLWFLPLDGVSVIDPHHLALNKLPPPVHIEQIVADGKTYDLSSQGSDGVHLPPRVRDFTIDYTALSLVVPEKVRFRFKLEGQDADWREVVNQRRVEYSNLPPRHYRFRVMASNNSGVWNQEGATLEFTIAPAYYQTNWFRLLCSAAFLALLWALYRARIQQLRRQESKLRDVIETIPTFAWTALPDGSVDFVNRHWQEYTGLSAERTVGSGWQAAVHAADLKRHAEKWRVSLATGEPFENEVRYRRAADEQYRRFLARAVPLRDQRGKILKWYGISTDIEDRRRAEEEREKLRADLAHVNRVSTLGEMAASLAHEIKQPIAATITSANTCIEWLAHEPPNLDRARAAAGRIDKYGNRAAEIIDRIRSLYKKSPPQREPVEVNEIIREMVELLRAEANLYAVSIRTDLVADLPKITADRVQLRQVFMNLILNAIEAMKETGGVLTVKTQLGENSQLLISVSDTGVGLPKEKTEQIFDTFFTTKPQGSGMGLSISRSIVEAHGGRLWATANDGRGATFHFTLPTAAEVHDSVASGDRAGPGDGSSSNDPVV
jgi:PAS domain S-box-containing protein